MYKIFKSILVIIWILDVINMPFMNFLDTTYPINGLAWFLIFLLLPSSDGDGLKIKITHKRG